MDFWGWWLLFLVVGVILVRAEARARLKKAYQFQPENTLAGARFADNGDLKRVGAFKGKGIRVGWSPDGKRPIYYKGSGHLLSVAAPRTGKGVSLLIPALLQWAHSCIVVDPKMELCAVTAHGRRRFGSVYVLDPFGMAAALGVKGLRFVGFNPMADLDPDSPGFHSDCDKLAAACIPEQGGEGYHFSVAALVLASGVTGAVARHGKPEEKNLATVARIISGGKVLDFCREVVSQTKDPDIIAKLGRFATDEARTSKEVADVIATAVTQLGFISGAIAKHLSADTGLRWWKELKTNPGTTVYSCVPLKRLDVCGDKYFRLFVETLMSSLLDENQRGKPSPVLMLIDEFAQLGPRMKSIENAMGMAAGACGLQLWLVVQSISQIVGMFPNSWSNLIQGCGATMWFGARDHETRKVISDLAGVTEVMSRSRNVSRDPKNGVHFSDSMSQYARPLLHPYEAGQLPDDSMVLFMEGVNGAVLAKRKPYFQCAEFKGRYRDNPYFQKHGRGLAGWLFGK